MSKKTMIPQEEASKRTLETASIIGEENIDFQDSLGRIIAQDVTTDIDIPSFDKSAMDGYACRTEDIKNALEVIETIAAGDVPKKIIKQNQCSKIMTGAMIPQGANCVIMVEHTEQLGDNKIRFTKETTKSNIRYKAEDIKADSIVLGKGTKINAAHIAVLATVGCIKPLVYKLPKVAVISTGNELVEPKQKPNPSQIRNSNAYQLIAQLSSLGIKASYIGIADDSEKSTTKIIKDALKKYDVVLLTGGVSMGDYDYVPLVLEKLGAVIHFDSVAVQPGSPTLFATLNQRYVFGLPGNPVSSFIQFELLVKPFLYKLMGHDYKPTIFKLPMGTIYERKKSHKKSWIPIKINTEGLIIPIEYHGSAHINAMADADGIIAVSIGETTIKKGDLVDVRPL